MRANRLEKPRWKAATKAHRCSMLADGFFERETIGKRELGRDFSLHGRRPFAVVGLPFEATVFNLIGS